MIGTTLHNVSSIHVDDHPTQMSSGNWYRRLAVRLEDGTVVSLSMFAGRPAALDVELADNSERSAMARLEFDEVAVNEG